MYIVIDNNGDAYELADEDIDKWLADGSLTDKDAIYLVGAEYRAVPTTTLKLSLVEK